MIRGSGVLRYARDVSASNDERRFVTVDGIPFQSAAVIKGGGQKVVRDGQTIESEDDSQKYLLEQAQNFQQKRLPVLRALQIV